MLEIEILLAQVLKMKSPLYKPYLNSKSSTCICNTCKCIHCALQNIYQLFLTMFSTISMFIFLFFTSNLFVCILLPFFGQDLRQIIRTHLRTFSLIVYTSVSATISVHFSYRTLDIAGNLRL